MTSLNSGPSQANTPETPTFCSFTVGQHVVCVSLNGLEEWRLANYRHPGAQEIKFPVINRVYTVRAVFIDPHYSRPCLLLKELVNKPYKWRLGTYEAGFEHRHFRPLKKLSVEDFMHGDAPIDLRILDEVRP